MGGAVCMVRHLNTDVMDHVCKIHLGAVCNAFSKRPHHTAHLQGSLLGHTIGIENRMPSCSRVRRSVTKTVSVMAPSISPGSG